MINAGSVLRWVSDVEEEMEMVALARCCRAKMAGVSFVLVRAPVLEMHRPAQ